MVRKSDGDGGSGGGMNVHSIACLSCIFLSPNCIFMSKVKPYPVDN